MSHKRGCTLYAPLQPLILCLCHTIIVLSKLMAARQYSCNTWSFHTYGPLPDAHLQDGNTAVAVLLCCVPEPTAKPSSSSLHACVWSDRVLQKYNLLMKATQHRQHPWHTNSAEPARRCAHQTLCPLKSPHSRRATGRSPGTYERTITRSDTRHEADAASRLPADHQILHLPNMS